MDLVLCVQSAAQFWSHQGLLTPGRTRRWPMLAWAASPIRPAMPMSLSSGASWACVCVQGMAQRSQNMVLDGAEVCSMGCRFSEGCRAAMTGVSC
jgi:hypothetical protein